MGVKTVGKPKCLVRTKNDSSCAINTVKLVLSCTEKEMRYPEIRNRLTMCVSIVTQENCRRNKLYLCCRQVLSCIIRDSCNNMKPTSSV